MAQAYQYQIIEDTDSNIAADLGTADAAGWEVVGVAYEGLNANQQRIIGVLMKQRIDT